MRNLIVILGDQLDRDSSVFDGFDAALDHIWMAEVREESTHVWSHKARTALFLSAMRHFAAELAQKSYPLTYLRLTEHAFSSLESALAATILQLNPARVVLTKPGDYRVRENLKAVCAPGGN